MAGLEEKVRFIREGNEKKMEIRVEVVGICAEGYSKF